MIRMSLVLTLALALSSCGEQGDTAGAGRFRWKISDGQYSGSFENTPAKSVADELLKRFRGDWRSESHSSSETSTTSTSITTSITFTDSSAPLHGYDVTNKLTNSPGKTFTFKFKFKDLKATGALHK